LLRVQARKPYTISKARERWSEEEHQRFVEAVRLHGRAWRKIEGELGYQPAAEQSRARRDFLWLAGC
jgi:SHAQKYF class myb-like DNA-binding protein